MSEVVSIVVPVYNVERYLEECVGSIGAQTYDALEILLVDDGSTDNSGALCDKLAQQDSRIRVFHKPNGGVASARNHGLDHATGQWVLLVDADDRIEPDLVARCMEALGRTKSDIAMFQYRSIDESGNPHPWDGPLNRFSEETVLTRNEAIARVINGPYEYYPWCYIARRSLYEHPEPIRFPEGRAMEDEATVYKPHARARSVAYLPYRLYGYRQRSQSRMRSGKAAALASARAQNAWEMYVFLRDQSLPETVYRSLLAKTAEKEIGAYYGALRSGSGPSSEALTYMNSVMDDSRMRRGDLGLGLRVRAFAMRHHLAGLIVAMERAAKH